MASFLSRLIHNKGTVPKKRKKGNKRAASTQPFGGMFGNPQAMDAPEGFRSVPFTHAMMEFGKPIMDMGEELDLEPNDSLQVIQLIWNYSQSIIKNMDLGSSQSDIKKSLKSTFGMNAGEAEAFMEKMLQRKLHLLPPEIQPEMAMTLFIRKEKKYDITGFDYSDLHVSDDVFPADDDDLEPFKDIRFLDVQMDKGADYDSWGDVFEGMGNSFTDRYFVWLGKKGVDEKYAGIFPFVILRFIDFIYQFAGVSLKSINESVLRDFLLDFSVRKVMTTPDEYIVWPATLKLFFRFLEEKEHIDNAEQIAGWIDKMEPKFVAMLKKRY